MAQNTIGTIDIELRANTAQLSNDLQGATSIAATSSRALASEMRAQMTEATHSVHLVSDELGIQVPRVMQRIIAQTPGFTSVLAAALPIAAWIKGLDILQQIPEAVKTIVDRVSGYADLQKQLDDTTKAANTSIAEETKAIEDLDKAFRQLHMSQAQKLADDEADDERKGLKLAKDLGDKRDELANIQKQLAETTTTMVSPGYGFPAAPKQTTIAESSNPLDIFTTRNLNTEAQTVQKAIDEVNTKLIKATESAAFFGEQAKDAFGKEASDAAQKLIDDMEQFRRVTPQLAPTADMMAAFQAQQKPLPPGAFSGTQDMDAAWAAIDQNTQRAIQQYNQFKTAATQAFTDTRTPMEQYSNKVWDLTTLLEKGVIDEQTFDRAVTNAGQQLDEATKSTDLFAQATSRMGDQLGKALLSGELHGSNFLNIIKSMIVALGEFIIKTEILSQIQSTTGVSGFFRSFLGGLTGRASGGPVSANTAYMVGEQGPELFVPSTGGSIVPSGATLGGPTIHYTIDARGATPGTEQRIMQALRMSEDRSVARSVAAVQEYSRRT